MNNKKDSRCRNWTIVLYPESAPLNWCEIINSWHIEFIVSPLHDRDLNSTGEPKKPHYHILLMFGGVKSYEQVCELIEPLNCPIPQRTHSAKALVRYMVHMDNPEKAQYNLKDVRAFGGVDLDEMLRPSSSERYSIISEMVSFCIDNCITEFYQLVMYAQENERDTWFPLLCDNCSYLMGQVVKSIRHSNKRC